MHFALDLWYLAGIAFIIFSCNWHCALDAHVPRMVDPQRYQGLLGGLQAPLIHWQASNALAAADDTLAHLRTLGVRIPPRCRLEQSRDAIRRVSQFNVQLGHGDSATERLYVEAHRTILESYLITRDLQPPTPETADRLRRMLGGPLVPTPGRHDPARDIQAEFFAAVLLFGSGFRVYAEEPDLKLSQAGEEWPVAVKRVTSGRNFQKRMREARDQLTRAQRPGFIAVSADQFLVERYERDREADLSAIHYGQIAEWTDRLVLRPRNNPVVGVIGLCTSFRHIRGTPSAMNLTLHFHQRFITWQEPALLRAAETSGAAMADSLARMLERVFPG